MALPRSAKCSSTFTWNDDTNFSGYLLVGLVPPIGRTFANIDNFSTSLRCPTYVRIKIKDGTPDQSVGVIYNADLNPGGFRYVAWLEDEQKTVVAGPSAIFTVNSTTFAPVFTGEPAAPLTADTPPTPNWLGDDLM